MAGWSCDQNVCASCRFWSGKREIDFTGTFFNAFDKTGDCQKPFGPFHGLNMGEGSYCPKWEPFENRQQ